MNMSYAEICRRGSKSFFFASLLFPAKVRADIFVLYAFARFCDDLIDDGTVSKLKALQELDEAVDWIYKKTHTIRPAGVLGQISTDLREVIERRQIPIWILKLLLRGFKMDEGEVNLRTIEELDEYSMGVAASIGIFCIYTFTDLISDELIERASCLGVGFQYTNIARDIWTDHDMGRNYVPWMTKDDLTDPEKTLSHAQRLISSADAFYKEAWKGVQMLPWRVRPAVGSACLIYREIGTKIQHQRCYQKRTVVGLGRKVYLAMQACVYLLLGMNPQWKSSPDVEASVLARVRRVLTLVQKSKKYNERGSDDTWDQPEEKDKKKTLATQDAVDDDIQQALERRAAEDIFLDSDIESMTLVEEGARGSRRGKKLPRSPSRSSPSGTPQSRKANSKLLLEEEQVLPHKDNESDVEEKKKDKKDEKKDRQKRDDAEESED